MCNGKSCVLFAVTSAALLAAIRDPVRVEGGVLSGVPGALSRVRVFKGIPFAAPPVGNLRWRAPQPVTPWKGVRKADRFSNVCMQKPHENGSYYQLEFYREPELLSEDCLYLNVWTAAESELDKRPVLVWIHGGGYSQGSGSTLSQTGQSLAKKGVVVVTFNYRLGIFGLLAHPELTRESEHHASGNYLLMDQIAALRWVQKNIAAFGGDPKRVTIFGQSAGSSSGALLLASPLAKDLFQAVAGQSGFLGAGSAGSSRDQTLQEAEQQGAALGQNIGAPTLAALRAKSAHELLESSDRQFRPITDGYVMPEDLYAIFAKGEQTKMPVLLGSNSNERGNYPHPRSMQEYIEYTRRQYPDAMEEVMKEFPASNDREATQAYLERERDRMASGMRRWAELMSKKGAPAYLCYFDRKPPARAGETPLGAVHTAEIVYFRNALDTVDRPWTLLDRKLAGIMSSYLVNFATNGDPNGGGLPKWPAYKRGQVMELGDNIGPISTPDQRELDWLDQYFERRRARR